jgi:hypothetical protein
MLNKLESGGDEADNNRQGKSLENMLIFLPVLTFSRKINLNRTVI